MVCVVVVGIEGIEIGLSPGDFVLDEVPNRLPEKGMEPPKFPAHIYCDQTAAWIKIALCMEVGLSPDDFVLHGDPAPSQKGAEPSPQF